MKFRPSMLWILCSASLLLQECEAATNDARIHRKSPEALRCENYS